MRTRSAGRRRRNGDTARLAPIAALRELGVEGRIQATPNEVEPAIPFAEDREHASYDPRAARLFWGQLLQADRVLGAFRSRFVGKVSLVHFFWGAMDLACTRSPGGGEEGAFYAYAYPEPAGYAGRPALPGAASYSREHGEFLLPYEVVAEAL